MAYSQQSQPYGMPPHMQGGGQPQPYQISTSQAAAMASAAATGHSYYMQDPSYRPGPGKPDARLGVAQQMPQRHAANHATSPPMQPPQGLMGQGRAPVPPQLAGQAGQQQSSPEAAAPAAEEAPLYVNAKQFHRILKRRVARQKLEEQLRLTNKARKPYLHESRHNHAMRRPRGPGGRFLTADEVAAMDKKAAEGEGGDDIKDDDENTPADSSPAQGSKRKAERADEESSKKTRLSEGPDNDDDDGNDDDGDEVDADENGDA